ncbi:hypothetical protein SKAU_G00143270 [Synaphobranchus kaupii]|uniref:Uncharacterized protein n=1 Tax=Synaphobranchus kaupii TaxID=118154 RepID=A0A9Q1J473_SYNKA|nr:hypothetical protein SKAU_G00143270 [Synaphobranchus kaupii]
MSPSGPCRLEIASDVLSAVKAQAVAEKADVYKNFENPAVCPPASANESLSGSEYALASWFGASVLRPGLQH